MNDKAQRALERVPQDNTIYTVYLDSGSFAWLYEILQAKTRTQVWLKPYQALVRRTLLSFDEARKLSETQAEIPPKRYIPRNLPPKRRKR